MKRHLILIPILILVATACASWKQVPAPQPIPPPTELGDHMTTVSVPVPDAEPDQVTGFAARLKRDFELLGPKAQAGNDAVGVQCSTDGLTLMAALPSALVPHTGYFLTDTETARLAQQSSILALANKVAMSCAPLLVGPAKFWGALGAPKALQDILTKGGGQ